VFLCWVGVASRTRVAFGEEGARDGNKPGSGESERLTQQLPPRIGQSPIVQSHHSDKSAPKPYKADPQPCTASDNVDLRSKLTLHR
jgi:hypothetical protein